MLLLTVFSLLGILLAPIKKVLKFLFNLLPQWLRVMMLCGLDYFSTLAYAPTISFLAAGFLAPFATLALVIVSFGAYAMYKRVVVESHEGQGSIAMYRKLMRGWFGKIFVLVILGGAFEGFIITMTLSGADGSKHVIENPLSKGIIPDSPLSQLILTQVFLIVLAVIFYLGFEEAIAVAVPVVSIFLTMTGVIVLRCLFEIITHPYYLINWWGNVQHMTSGNLLVILPVAILLFPKLALGLSGMETGVSMAPLIQGYKTDTPEHPIGRIRRTQLMIRTAVTIMAVMLVLASVVSVCLIPPEYMKEGGEADGRAFSWLAHHFLSDNYGSPYDISSISMLVLAGASAMVGILNLAPNILGPLGMLPRFINSRNKLVTVVLVIASVTSFIYHADVNDQASAYAVGVLTLISSAALAVFIFMAVKKDKSAKWFMLITALFIYTLVQNATDPRAELKGVYTALFFVVLTIVSSLLTRGLRNKEISRIERVELDQTANWIIQAVTNGKISLIAHDPINQPSAEEYASELARNKASHNIKNGWAFLEVTTADSSEFGCSIHVTGHKVGEFYILRCTAPAIANAIAAVLVHVHDMFEGQKEVHMNFGLTMGNPALHSLRYLITGKGDISRLTASVLYKFYRETFWRKNIKLHTAMLIPHDDWQEMQFGEVITPNPNRKTKRFGLSRLD